ncbi:tetratricopeptide repeat protein [Leptolyngbya sp. NIES-2104]|uniref:tetratricopeptide repeat protein n=1 Tax=Leptolyngbya sp. NIES-2104 TaxID=1552121 RepID=UPI0006ECBCA9|nr:tetratricopeptide repeat protein [Leptolyngbya sp. NIES-2104]GAP97706.1 TPR repeat [Leptolyngbya sp. NIES-2104]
MSNQFERARLLFEQRRFDLAVKELHQGLAIDPDDASCHRLLALCFAQLNQEKDAIAQIDRAIALEPNHGGAHYIKAGILRDQGNLKAAKSSVLEALRLDPEDTDSYARLAAIQFDQKKPKEALITAEKGLQIDPENIGCMNLRVLSLTELGQLSQAEEEVTASLGIAPENHFAHAVRGWIAFRQHRMSIALESFQTALRLKPDLEWARQGLVEALKAQNGIYRFVLSVDRFRVGMVRGPWMALLLIPQFRALYWLLLLIVVVVRPFFTVLLSFDAYGKMVLTSKEINRSRVVVGIVLAIVLMFLLPILVRSR